MKEAGFADGGDAVTTLVGGLRTDRQAEEGTAIPSASTKGGPSQLSAVDA